MRVGRHISVIASLFCFPAGGHAASQCTFTTECYEGEICQETQFELTFRAGTGGPFEMELVTDAETIGVAVGGTGEFAHLAGMTESGFYVLTLASADGAARFTAHLADGPQAITYLGTCEVGQ